MSLDLITRSEMGWGATPAPRTNTDRGMVAHYDSSTWLTTRRRTLTAGGEDPHQACFEYWRRVRTIHKNQGWVDVGYAYFCCPDDQIFEGRGYGHQQAAELPTPGKIQNGNSRYVSATFGLGIGESPTAGALRAWHRLRRWLLDEKGVREKVYGHRNFTFTDCPGDTIYSLVTDGTLKGVSVPTPVPDTPAPTPAEEKTMYAAFGSSETGVTEVPPGEWTDIKFDTEFSDPDGAHSGSNPTVLRGVPYVYVLEFGANVEDAPAGTAFEIDTAEYEYDASVTPAVDRLREEGKPTAETLSDALKVHHAAVGYLQKGRKLRVRIKSHAAGPVKIRDARVSVAFWE